MKNETVISVQGVGTFLIPSDKVQQLIGWLNQNKAVGVNENTTQPGGTQILRG